MFGRPAIRRELDELRDMVRTLRLDVDRLQLTNQTLVADALSATDKLKRVVDRMRKREERSADEDEGLDEVSAHVMRRIQGVD